MFPFDKTTEIEQSFDENESDFWCQLSSLNKTEFPSFESYVQIDENESTEMETYLNDEEIIQEVYSNRDDSEMTIESEEDMESKQISNSQALNCINELQKYFWQNSNNSFDQSLIEMQKNVT